MREEGGGRGQRWQWVALAGAIWMQAAGGTNFDFPAYSAGLKAALGTSQAGLNGLALASDLGKALGWTSGVAALRLPLPVVLVAAAAMGFAGYGVQWLLVACRLPLHYPSVFVSCLLAGCSICWLNTACFSLCTRAFPSPRCRPLALSLTVSFNGASAALYALAASAVPSSHYLFLNAVVPLAACATALPAALRYADPCSTAGRNDGDECRRGAGCADAFPCLYTIAFITGLYLLFVAPVSPGSATTARRLLAGAAALLLLPLLVPTLLLARHRERPTGKEATVDDVQLLQDLLLSGDHPDTKGTDAARDGKVRDREPLWWRSLPAEAMEYDRLMALGEEHTARRLLRRVDFWLYYAAYLLGATLGLVYSNNLGQVAQSLGRGGDGTTALVEIYSACSFFGRLLSSSPELFCPQEQKRRLARTGLLAAGLAPMPAAFFLLAWWGSGAGVLLICTAVVGLSSGFVVAGTVSVTAELFGAESVGVNHNILVTGIPLGSLLYGLLAARIYDAGAAGGGGGGVCTGELCYAETFRLWGWITAAGLACSAALFLRTKAAYARLFEAQWRLRADGGVEL